MTERVTHFSDGEQAVCGVLDEPAVLDPQGCNCEKCLEIMAEKAEKEGDPMIKVKVIDLTLDLEQTGQDFNFVYQREPILIKGANGKSKVKQAFEPKHYHLLNGEVYSLPTSTVKHMESLSWPYSRYKEGQEEGRSMVVAGKRHRFLISRL